MQESFFSELAGVFKKHFLTGSKKAPIRLYKKECAKTAAVAPESPCIINRSRQDEIQHLCNQLVHKKNMVASGKLKMIGLGEVRECLGERWQGAKAFIYKTVENVIEEYTSPGDLFVRYGDDQYIVIYAEASLNEAEVRTSLMAQEIQKRLREFLEENPEKLQMTYEVRATGTKKLRKTKSLDETINTINCGRIHQDLTAPAHLETTTIWEHKKKLRPGFPERSSSSKDSVEGVRKGTIVIPVSTYKKFLKQHSAH